MAASMTGEQIQALADALKPLTPKNLGPAVQGFAIAFGIVGVIVVCLRIYVRAGLSGVSPRLLGFEDYLAVLATILLMPAVVFSVLAARYGVGSRDANIPSHMYLIRAVEYQTYWELFYFTSSTIIKCAIGLTCIRLDGRKRVLFPICVNMSIMVIVTVLALAFVFANCKPFSATWNPALGTCQKVISLQTVSYIVSAIQMATDWACAIIPFFIVAGLQMSRRRKTSVIAILSLGVSASIATCIRMPYLRYYDTVKYPNEIGYHLGVVSITSNVECCLGIIAFSLPPLRKLFNFYYGSSHEANYPYAGESENVLQNSGQGIRLDSINGRKGTFHVSAQRGTSRAGDHETDDDNSSTKIHPIYSLWFFWVDPILTLVGMYVNFIDHDLAMQAFFTNYPLTDHFRCFIYHIGGMGTSYLIILVMLLRYTHDIFIWKTVQLAILPADFTMLTAIYIGMRISGNLALADWRREDWFSIVVTGICTVLRIAFVMGVGVKDTRGRAKRA
ncbi:integral membrane [Fusarium agapanthi]|uniref:Integral membrane n=1 Tax=Fusarium agapanthi TaxID=1803897 RepID=A0A9P5EG12_9HYPO|nr:integral membrane [Fusarium agapanthi]